MRQFPQESCLQLYNDHPRHDLVILVTFIQPLPALMLLLLLVSRLYSSIKALLSLLKSSKDLAVLIIPWLKLIIPLQILLERVVFQWKAQLSYSQMTTYLSLIHSFEYPEKFQELCRILIKHKNRLYCFSYMLSQNQWFLYDILCYHPFSWAKYSLVLDHNE